MHGSLAHGAGDVLHGVPPAHPLSALIGIPAPATRDAGVPTRIEIELGNAFMGGTAGDERLLLDGETTRLSIDLRRALNACTDVALELAFLAHAGGYFDARIESWHDTFGLPNAGREDVPRDAVLFEYLPGDGGPGAPALERSTNSLADTTLSVRRRLGCAGATSAGRDASVFVRAGVKLPTGSLDDWSGSEAVDAFVDVQSPVLAVDGGGRFAASAGLLLAGDTDALARQNAVVAYGALGGTWTFDPRFALHASVDAHSPLADSDLTEVGQGGLGLATGFSFAPVRGTRVDVQILEDLLIDTATDIRLRVAVTLGRPGR